MEFPALEVLGAIALKVLLFFVTELFKTSPNTKQQSEETPSTSASSVAAAASSASSKETEGPVQVVRGRVKDESKSETFNKLWSVEEQKKLEELLLTFPAEEVEARRWAKIAKALGNRTPQQVLITSSLYIGL